jgi:hypothetical protein
MGHLISLKHNIYRPKVSRQNPFGLSKFIYKYEGQGGKTGLF